MQPSLVFSLALKATEIHWVINSRALCTSLFSCMQKEAAVRAAAIKNISLLRTVFRKRRTPKLHLLEEFVGVLLHLDEDEEVAAVSEKSSEVLGWMDFQQGPPGRPPCQASMSPSALLCLHSRQQGLRSRNWPLGEDGEWPPRSSTWRRSSARLSNMW